MKTDLLAWASVGLSAASTVLSGAALVTVRQLKALHRKVDTVEQEVEHG